MSDSAQASRQIYSCEGIEEEYHTEGKMVHSILGDGLIIVSCHSCKNPFIIEVNGTKVWESSELIKPSNKGVEFKFKLDDQGENGYEAISNAKNERQYPEKVRFLGTIDGVENPVFEWNGSYYEAMQTHRRLMLEDWQYDAMPDKFEAVEEYPKTLYWIYPSDRGGLSTEWELVTDNKEKGLFRYVYGIHSIPAELAVKALRRFPIKTYKPGKSTIFVGDADHSKFTDSEMYEFAAWYSDVTSKESDYNGPYTIEEWKRTEGKGKEPQCPKWTDSDMISAIELSIRINTDEKESYHSLAEWAFDHWKMDKSE